MKHLIIITVAFIVFTSCKKEVTYDYMIYNNSTTGNVQMKVQTVDLKGDAIVSFDIQRKMGMSIFTEKVADESLHNKEMGNDISVINKILLQKDGKSVSIDPKKVSYWKFQKLSSTHGIYSLYLTDESFKEVAAAE
ncbi:MAG: hypothetical protein RIQ33_1193 [Bacteroidota bacterium]|jgi:hypothetical protein